MRIDENDMVFIPKELLERFGLHPGSDVELEVSRNGILIKPMETHREHVAQWLEEEHGSETASLKTEDILRMMEKSGAS